MPDDKLEEKINHKIKVIQDKLQATEKDVADFRRILELKKETHS